MLTVRVDGTVNREITTRLSAAVITDHSTPQADTAELTIAVAGDNIALPRQGAVLTFFYKNKRVGGSYAVDKVSGSKRSGTMIIGAREYDVRNDLRSARTASHADSSLGTILQSIAARYGLTSVIPANLSNLAPAESMQIATSDLSYLTSAARSVGGRLQIKDGRLIVLPIGGGISASGKALPVHTIDGAALDVWWDYQVTDRQVSRARARYFAADGVTIKAVDVGEGLLVEELPTTYANEAAATRAANSAIAEIAPEAQQVQLTLPLTLTIAATHRINLINIPKGIKSQLKAVKISHFFGAKSPQKTVIFCALF